MPRQAHGADGLVRVPPSGPAIPVTANGDCAALCDSGDRHGPRHGSLTAAESRR